MQAVAVMLFISSSMGHGKATLCKAVTYVFMGFTESIYLQEYIDWALFDKMHAPLSLYTVVTTPDLTVLACSVFIHIHSR